MPWDREGGFGGLERVALVRSSTFPEHPVGSLAVTREDRDAKGQSFPWGSSQSSSCIGTNTPGREAMWHGGWSTVNHPELQSPRLSPGDGSSQNHRRDQTRRYVSVLIPTPPHSRAHAREAPSELWLLFSLLLPWWRDRGGLGEHEGWRD